MSALAYTTPQRLPPPAKSTRPSARATASPEVRDWVRLPVRVHAPVAGSKISVELPAGGSAQAWLKRAPPATSTRPFGSGAAASPMRSQAMLPVTLHVPVVGSYSSAVLRPEIPLMPPATSTRPSERRMATWAKRVFTALPVPLNALVLNEGAPGAAGGPVTAG